MAKYLVKSPDGAEYDVEAPEGATEAQAIEYVQGEIAAGRLKPKPLAKTQVVAPEQPAPAPQPGEASLPKQVAPAAAPVPPAVAPSGPATFVPQEDAAAQIDAIMKQGGAPAPAPSVAPAAVAPVPAKRVQPALVPERPTAHLRPPRMSPLDIPTSVSKPKPPETPQGTLGDLWDLGRGAAELTGNSLLNFFGTGLSHAGSLTRLLYGQDPVPYFKRYPGPEFEPHAPGAKFISEEVLGPIVNAFSDWLTGVADKAAEEQGPFMGAATKTAGVLDAILLPGVGLRAGRALRDTSFKPGITEDARFRNFYEDPPRGEPTGLIMSKGEFARERAGLGLVGPELTDVPGRTEPHMRLTPEADEAFIGGRDTLLRLEPTITLPKAPETLGKPGKRIEPTWEIDSPQGKTRIVPAGQELPSGTPFAPAPPQTTKRTRTGRPVTEGAIPQPPSSEAGWREVADDEVLQPGQEIRMNMKTGKNYVREALAAAPQRGYELPGESEAPMAGLRVVEGVQRRRGGVETGEQLAPIKQVIGFNLGIEQLLFDHGAAFEKMTKEPKAESDAFRRLQDRIKNMTSEEEAAYGWLKKTPIEGQKRAAQRYRDQVRGELARAARDKEAAGWGDFGIRARPYDRSIYPGEGGKPHLRKMGVGGPPRPIPPTGEGGAPELPPAPSKPKYPAEVQARLDESEAAYRETRKSLEDHLKRLQAQPYRPETSPTAEVHGQTADIEAIKKQLHGLGMRHVAEKRQITGELTFKEQQAADKRAASNYKGKPVSVEGRKGIVQGMAFGKVRVKFEDGKVESVEQAKVTAEDFGPGTLGANPFGAFVKGSIRLAKKALTSMTGVFDANQLAEDSALGPVGAAQHYARVQRAAKHFAELDSRPGADEAKITTEYQAALAETKQYRRLANLDFKAEGKDAMVPATERMDRLIAREEFQAQGKRDMWLVHLGGANQKGFTELKLWATKNKDGSYLHVRDDAFNAVRQNLKAYDLDPEVAEGGLSKARNRTLGAFNLSTAAKIWSPYFHPFTVGGRMEPFFFKKNSMAAPRHWQRATETMEDRDAYRQFMIDGLEPFPHRWSETQTGAQRGWLETQMKKNGVTGNTYDALRYLNSYTSRFVNYGQMVFESMKEEDFLNKGYSPEAARRMAIQESNLLAGNLARETMRPTAYAVLGPLLFSRSYTSTVIRQVTRAFTEDKVLKASLKQAGVAPAEIERAMKGYQRELQFALGLDYMVYQIQANALNYFMTGASNEPDKNGKPGPHFIAQNKGNTSSDWPIPHRIFITRNDDGSSIYMRVPNRTTLDQAIFLESVPEMIAKGGTLPEWEKNKPNVLTKAIARQLGFIKEPGKPMGDTAATLANMADPFTPTSELQWEAAEAWRQGDADLVTGPFMKQLTKTLTTIPGFLKAVGIVFGGQIREYPPGYEETKGSGEGYRQKQFLQDRINMIRRDWDSMDADAQSRVQESLRAEAKAAGILPKDIATMMMQLRRGERKSPHAKRQAEKFREAETQ